MEEKYLSEEELKVEKNYLHNKKKFVSLRKRIDFLFVRDNGFSHQGEFVILNYLQKKAVKTRIGFTVTKKMGNATKRNYIKRLIRAILIKNHSKIPDNFDMEIIPKKQFCEIKFTKVESDILDLLKRIKI